MDIKTGQRTHPIDLTPHAPRGFPRHKVGRPLAFDHPPVGKDEVTDAPNLNKAISVRERSGMGREYGAGRAGKAAATGPIVSVWRGNRGAGLRAATSGPSGTVPFAGKAGRGVLPQGLGPADGRHCFAPNDNSAGLSHPCGQCEKRLTDKRLSAPSVPSWR